MSVTTQPTTFADLYTLLMNAVRVDTSQSATISQAKRAINMALQDLHLGTDYKFPWAERIGRLLVRDQYTTGTVSISKGSTTLTGSSTVWTTTDAFGVANARANGKVTIAGGRTPYVVSTVSGAGTITLSSKFTETTVAAGSTYVYYEDEYDLASDFLRPVDFQRFFDDTTITLIGRTEFRRLYPTNSTPSRPRNACLIDYAPSGNTTPIRRVRFNPPPSTAMTISYAYITSNLAVTSAGIAGTALSGDTDEPIVPLRYRHAIFYYALGMWYRDKKDDSRSQEAMGQYTDIMLRIMSDVDMGSNRPQLQPYVSGYRSRARNPWRGGARFDLNGRFDRLS